MLEKINGKNKLLFHCFIVSLFFVLIYSRFVGLDWGLPYPMHPDERNMATAIQQLSCQLPNVTFNLPQSIFGEWDPVNWIRISEFDFFNCFNPHFFAYGQLPLYLGYVITFFLKFFDGDLASPISFQEAAISLRIISATASIISVYVLVNIVILISNIKYQISKTSSKFKDFNFTLVFALCTLIFTLSPYAIQFAHFGTTESLLMMFYTAIIYYSLLFIDKKIHTLSFVVSSSVLVGLSLSTKVSSAVFLIVPFLVLLFNQEIFRLKTSVSTSKNSLSFFVYRLMSKIIDLTILVFLSLVIFFIFSPHNFLNFPNFIGSMNYESEVALGKSLVFYTRQFFEIEPFYFQFEKIFPYVLGWPVFLMGMIGLIGNNWKDKKTNLLRFAFLIYFIPSAMIYAKWSRFMAPIFPIITIFAIIFISKIKDQISKISLKFKTLRFTLGFALWTLIFAMIVPGLAYLHIYQVNDVRFQASEWIYKNIPNRSYILSETANVVDIPTNNGTMEQSNNYSVISFNFYDLDQSPELQLDLMNHLEKADYIFIPSRRIFANHTCEKFSLPAGRQEFSIFNFQSDLENKCQNLKQKYPILNKYYEDLFSGKLGFEEVAKFDSFPQINFQLSNFKFQIKYPDEEAEETWTVFDHPVIRIYKKVKY